MKKIKRCQPKSQHRFFRRLFFECYFIFCRRSGSDAAPPIKNKTLITTHQSLSLSHLKPGCHQRR